MNRFKLMALAAVSVPFVAGQAFAAGYEKSIMWGGRTAGVAGISTPYIMGSQALYFNPAGLVSDNVGQDVSFNISPNWSQFEGPINNNNDVVKSERQMTTPFGLIYGATLNDKIGFGVGGFVSGGSKAVYENVDVGVANAGEVKTDLVVAEISAGVGYKVNDSLKLGAAYRYSFASANLSLISRPGGPFFLNAKLTDLKDDDSAGFRLGAQYKFSERMLVGLTYRSEVKFDAKGKIAYTVLNTGGNASGAPFNLADGDATASTLLPQAATLGVQHNYDVWRALVEVAWTEYSKVKSVMITRPGGTSEVTQEWKDQYNVRLGGEYLAMTWPIRVGYGWTSQVTNTDYARASFTPPGQAHTLTVGTGMTWDVMGMPLQYDIAGEYTMASGKGEGAAAGTATAGSDIRAGDYSASTYGIHLGLTYAF
jgi:long-subunit fatty acid transport protein